MLTLSTNDLTQQFRQLDSVYMSPASGHDPGLRGPKPPTSAVLVGYTLLAFVGALVTAVLMRMDARILAGEPLWLKPIKFFLSSAIAAGTLEWIIRSSGLGSRRLNACRSVIAWGFLVEMVIICAQAARGVRSHFNFSTPLDAVLFGIMGTVIIGVVIAFGVAGFTATGTASRWARAERTAVRWGMVVFMAAAFMGHRMVRPTLEQQRQGESEGRSGMRGSHFVGSVEGVTRTWPVTGWSRESGDLRVPHFVGMHALQWMLLWALLARWLGVPMEDRRTVRHMTGVGILFGGIWLLTLGQASSGRSLLDPGAFQVGLWVPVGGLVVALVSLVSLVLGRNWKEVVA